MQVYADEECVSYSVCEMQSWAPDAVWTRSGRVDAPTYRTTYYTLLIDMECEGRGRAEQPIGPTQTLGIEVLLAW